MQSKPQAAIPEQGTSEKSMPAIEPEPGGRSTAWRYFVCAILLLATTINYLDRQTLSNMSIRVCRELKLSNEDYGTLETAFGLAFAAGAIFFGWLADRVSVVRLYPLVLLLWSAVGYLTGLVESFAGLLVCRTLLGLFEAGHWPCALRTTQAVFTPRERTFGNSILQSGSSVGSILTPLIVLGMVTDAPGSWRKVFQVVGLIGLGWIVLWIVTVRERDLRRTPAAAPTKKQKARGETGDASFWEVVFSRRFLVLLVVVTSINTAWHINRVWLPKFMQEGRHYTESQALVFNSVYYVFTDVGCIAAGLATMWMTRAGGSVHRTRMIVYTTCALMTSAALAVVVLPTGPWLIGVMLVVGAGSLGLFPCYYSFSQELSVTHQGKVTGLLGFCAWATSPLHRVLGRVIDETKSYDLVIGTAGVWPLLGAAALWFLWDSPVRKVVKPSAERRREEKRRRISRR